MTYHAKLIKGGKIVIPAELRREFGFKDGDTLVFEREGNALVLKTYQQIVQEVQAEFKRLVPNPGNVDEFLAERQSLWAEQ
jgi:AbrB family transcriptional regulator, stage V sporulation protein T